MRFGWISKLILILFMWAASAGAQDPHELIVNTSAPPESSWTLTLECERNLVLYRRRETLARHLSTPCGGDWRSRGPGHFPQTTNKLRTTVIPTH